MSTIKNAVMVPTKHAHRGDELAAKDAVMLPRKRSHRGDGLTALVFVLPITLGILIFAVYPIVFSLYASFTRWNLLNPPVWVGLDNYVTLFTKDPAFPQTLRNTLIFSICTVFIGAFLSLLVAMLLNKKIAGQNIFRALIFVPVIVPTAAAALTWGWLYDPSSAGIINACLKFIGIGPIPWLNNSHYALWAIIIEAIWAQLGFNTVIFLAGLQGIPQEYYEAAEIDGANSVNKFLHITLPCISPISFFILVTSIINAIQIFDIPWVMMNGGGGPGNATQMIVMYLYFSAFRLQRMGLASAMGYVVFVAIMIITFINFRLSKRWVFYEEAI
jgi:multiple sugar transport system permease protein